MYKQNKHNIKMIILILLVLFVGGFCVFLFVNIITKTLSGNDATKVQIASTSSKPVKHPGLGPKCPQNTCFTLLVNGDLLFHEGLWNGFSVDKNANNGKNFDFTPLFAGEKAYFDKSNIKVCDFETPISPQGGPYAAYPIFSIPPEVADGASALGYDACTTATNHAIDNGTDGIFRLLKKLDEVGIKHTGTNRSEADSKKSLILPIYDKGINTAYAKLGLVTGTVSLNGMIPDYDWRVDRLREGIDGDIQKMIQKAKLARKRGANVIAAAIHSVQEYIDYADSWQIETAHHLADSSEFNLIYSHGSHAVQPIEKYKNTWIIYGVGNSVTESADTAETLINNRGVTVRIQFAKNDDKKGDNTAKTGTNNNALIHGWYISNISWVPSFNVKGGKYAWCSLASDHPQGFCASKIEDDNLRDLIANTIYAMGADKKIVTQWLVSKEK